MIKLLSKINKLYIIKDNTDKFNYIIIKISYLRKYTQLKDKPQTRRKLVTSIQLTKQYYIWFTYTYVCY